MPPQTPLFRLLTPLLHTLRAAKVPPPPQSTSIRAISTTTPKCSILTSISRSSFPSSTQKKMSFSTTTSRAAAKNQQNQRDPRITLLRYHLMHPMTPRPLRLSRLRSLRHWTIHRAWLLFRRKEGERRERVLERQHQSMSAACEELRLLDPPGKKDSGRLYRIAMLKKGVFKQGGVPIEYAKAQVERPAKEAWNHGWTR